MRQLLLIMSLCCSGCSHFAQDEWTGRDKTQHYFASAFLAAAGNAYGQERDWRESHAASFGLAFSLSLGVAKEVADSRPSGTGWSWKDLAWDLAGAGTGYALWNLSH